MEGLINVSPELFAYIKKRIEAEVAADEISAAYGGGWPKLGDEKKALAYYDLGYHRILPNDWKEYKKEFEDLNDPEYTEFLRLREKFEKPK
jgi:hypothetical protein